MANDRNTKLLHVLIDYANRDAADRPGSVAGTAMLTLNHESLQCWPGQLHAFFRQRQSTMSCFPAAVPFSGALVLPAHSSRRSMASTPNKWPVEAAFFPATVKRRWCWPAASLWLPSSREPDGLTRPQ